MQKKKTNRRAQIIRQATRLFSEHGYKEVTIKQLADACTITEPALYRHFDSKAAIYSAVLDALEERLAGDKIFEELAKADDVELLFKGIAEHVLDFYRRNKDTYRLLLYSALEGHEKAKHVHDMIRGRYIKFIIAKLDELYAKGKIVKKNNEITARCFVGMVFDCALGFSLWKGMQGRTYKAADVIANNIPIYVRGIKK